MENKNVIITLPKSLWEKIASGEKKVEVRKNAPNVKFRVTKIYVIIKGTDIVAGYFTLKDIISCKNMWWFYYTYKKQIGVPFEWLQKYVGSPDKRFYGWEIGKVKCFKKMTLYRSYFGVKSNPQSFAYTEENY